MSGRSYLGHCYERRSAAKQQPLQVLNGERVTLIAYGSKGRMHLFTKSRDLGDWIFFIWWLLEVLA